jgi:hypothetical protein
MVRRNYLVGLRDEGTCDAIGGGLDGARPNVDADETHAVE